MSTARIPDGTPRPAHNSDPSARLRWETQEARRLSDMIGPDRSAEWLSVIKDLLLPGTRLVPMWDAIHLAMDTYQQGRHDAREDG